MRGQILYFCLTNSVFVPAFAPYGAGLKPVSSNRPVVFLFYDAKSGLDFSDCPPSMAVGYQWIIVVNALVLVKKLSLTIATNQLLA